MKQVAILGLGVVGGGTADLLRENAASITRRIGEEVPLRYVLDIRDLPESPYASLIVHDISVILSDPEVSVVAETIGGLHPAYEFTRACLEAGKSVVTSNKELVATYGIELQQIAAAHGVVYLFEASTGGAIPVLHPMMRDLAGNEMTAVSGILNGTTNYILTRMFAEGTSYEDALKEAQAKGYAERNPAADVEGHDTARKIAILTATATGILPSQSEIHTEGIGAIRAADVEAASHAGYSVKLLGRCLKGETGTYLMVAPFFVPTDCPLAGISDVNNGILITCNYAGDVMFYGRGAGAHPTASAVAGDILSAVRGDCARMIWRASKPGDFTSFDSFVCRRYTAVSECDRALITRLFGAVEDVTAEEGETAFIAPDMSESAYTALIASLENEGVSLRSSLRVFA